MKVFGIGLSRTGTVSLTTALKILGYNVIHSPHPVLVPGLIEEIKNWEGATDSGTALAYKELDNAFPNSKFILTTRDINGWLKSYENYLSKNMWIFEQDDELSKMQEILYGSVVFDRDKYKKTFRIHHTDVLEYFKNRKNDLLVIDFTNGDEWEKICKFLCCRTPYYQFPHNNKTEWKI